MTNTYQPKHMKVYDDGFDHCCFAGCSQMDEYGCCANMAFHKAGCPLNPSRQLDDAYHDIYVSQGMRKHLAPEPKIVGNISRFCPECGAKTVITKRVCFGADPHNEYRCTGCRWSGRNAGISIR